MTHRPGFAQHFRQVARMVLLGLTLTLAAVILPDSSVKPTEVNLIRIKQADGVSLERDVIWILAVGSDARRGEDMLRSRGDALQLVGINTQTGAATAIGVPRDSWVEIPGHGSQKINSALYFAGPRGIAGAMRNLTGISADYVLVTRFPFFEQMIDDIASNFGLGHLDRLPGGDFDRSANQQRTLRGIHARVRAMADQPGFIKRGVLTVLKHMATNASPAELYELAQAGAQVEPSAITTCVIRGRTGYVGAASVVFPDVAQARRLGRAARADATLASC